VIRNLKDSIPKIIGRYLVNKSQDNINTDLNELLQKGELSKWWAEPFERAQERESLTKNIEILKKSLKEILKDSEFTKFSNINQELIHQ